ncbi:hypothetical protein SBC1_75380 (plasmid) [Caballeronia sp. SBC1]|uniref:DUF3563 family protein n=1 Tax=unclassified Caballeronia TaxID=2646786 RepID=UPI0013E20625|nr:MULTISPECIES: DUF3563 family protein [unclassified Caballeronia]QIE30135.1 hypothetical protein SBC2_82110 [Caballeronia sp. SBC2]QIN67491.1 hypothetical protein SBC1_75380 [Caballeronia sp. SBC1]
MFVKFSKTLSEFLVTTEDQERESYLASSVDFADLEHRIHAFEMNHQPITLYSNGAPRDWHV